MTDNAARFPIPALLIVGGLLLWTVPAAGDLPAGVDVLLADSRHSPGSVYRAVARPFPFGVTTYGRAAGGVHSVAFGPDGWVYFADGNAYDILRTDGLGEELVYRHATYVRDLAFDSAGRLHFSEATGAGGDGVIHRVDTASGQATRWREIPLDDVGGYWAGHFAFDPADTLYLSSGNRVPAAIYESTPGGFVRRYPFDEPITGFVFRDARTILFTNHGQRLYALEGFSTRSIAFEYHRFEWLNDVTLVPEPPSSGPCSISGRLLGGAELWSITSILANGPDQFFRSLDGTRPAGDGSYRLSGLAAGKHWVRTDVRGDTTRGFEPRMREVQCAGAVTGVDFTFK